MDYKDEIEINGDYLNVLIHQELCKLNNKVAYLNELQTLRNAYLTREKIDLARFLLDNPKTRDKCIKMLKDNYKRLIESPRLYLRSTYFGMNKLWDAGNKNADNLEVVKKQTDVNLLFRLLIVDQVIKERKICDDLDFVIGENDNHDTDFIREFLFPKTKDDDGMER